jgi:hypothetical protein
MAVMYAGRDRKFNRARRELAPGRIDRARVGDAIYSPARSGYRTARSPAQGEELRI